MFQWGTNFNDKYHDERLFLDKLHVIDCSPGPLQDEYKRTAGSLELYFKIDFEGRPSQIHFDGNYGDD